MNKTQFLFSSSIQILEAHVYVKIIYSIMRYGLYIFTECLGNRMDGLSNLRWLRGKSVIIESFSEKLKIDLKSRGKKIFFIRRSMKVAF